MRSKKDADGRTIPARLLPVFRDQWRFRLQRRRVRALFGSVAYDLSRHPEAWARFNVKQFRALMANAQDLIQAAVPHIVCPYCGGEQSDGCRECKGAGFLSRAQARLVPKELRP
jgi:hypothetical protein